MSSKTSIAMGLVVGLVALSTGCGRGLPVHRAAYGPGQILIMPPRDVVQGGVPHEKGEGSGARLMDSIERELSARGWDAAPSPNQTFTHHEVAPKGAALAEGQANGAVYVLQVVLGEFRNAAPMSFRSDFVTLDDARMWDVASGDEVWSLKKQVMLQKSNIGNHLGLIDKFGILIGRSITQPPR